jgi:hypothetical protein
MRPGRCASAGKEWDRDFHHEETRRHVRPAAKQLVPGLEHAAWEWMKAKSPSRFLVCLQTTEEVWCGRPHCESSSGIWAVVFFLQSGQRVVLRETQMSYDAARCKRMQFKKGHPWRTGWYPRHSDKRTSKETAVDQETRQLSPQS